MNPLNLDDMPWYKQILFIPVFIVAVIWEIAQSRFKR